MGTNTARLQSTVSWGEFGAILAVMASSAFAFAVLWGDGHYDDVGVRYVTIATLMAVCAAGSVGRIAGDRIFQLVGAASLLALALQFTALSALPPGIYLSISQSQTELDLSRFLLFAGIVLVAVGFVVERRFFIVLRRLFLGVGFLIGGFWLLRASPSPEIDVWWLHQSASEAVLSLSNPYALTKPVFDTWGGDVLDAYPYPPVLLFFYTPFYVLFGDARFANLAAMLVIGWCTMKIARSLGSPSSVADALGAIVLLHPRALFILEQAWTEPLSVALIALGILSYVKHRMNLAAAIFGLALFSKQYLVIMAPILPFLPGFGWRRALASGAIAASIVAPFFLWNPAAFVHGVFETQLRAPPRFEDSNSIAAYLFRKEIFVPSWVSILLGFCVATIGAIWRRGNPGGLLAVIAAALTCLFALGKQAFANYYWLAGQLFVLSAALALAPTSQEDPLRLLLQRLRARFHGLSENSPDTIQAVTAQRLDESPK